ncbi:MAG TPA: hypothetical protein PLL98_01200 [Bacillota bacterium]|nr:hypothetical protein [Bacillota bacterium]HPL54544.1 hypothetical protein [Bacillota bacterium]
MTEYRGRWSAIKGPLIVLSVIIALVLTIYLFIPKGFFTYFFIALLLAFTPLAYSGLVLKIKIDENKLVVVRPFTRTTVRFEDVALCAMHCVEEGSYLIYAFVKQRYSKGYTVKGVKPKLPFDEVIKMSLDKEDINLDINFSRAKKVPLSFVENSEELKDRFMMEVGKYHVKIMENKD